jgi:F-type H+-transporting ATPase subunit delta
MVISSVAKRYAQALYEFAVEGNARDNVRADCIALRQLLDQSAAFREFAENPVIPPDVADETVRKLVAGKVDAVTLQFLRFLITKGRLDQLRAICDLYEEHICEELGVLKVGITAAHELSDAQLHAISQKLGSRYKKEIKAEVKVDPALIGGFRIKVGDRIQDFSLRTKLEKFEKQVIDA